MKSITMNPFLRGALALDAIASGAMGIGLSAAPGLLGGLFGLPAELLIYAGMFLIVYAAFVAWLALRQRPESSLVWLVIVGNGLWVIASLALMASGWVAPSALGYAFVIVQALAVGVFAELQFVGVRRAAPGVATA
jgi:hypothetical protein